MEDVQPIVFDCGTGVSKAGIAGDDSPRYNEPTVLGRASSGPDICELNIKPRQNLPAIHVGSEAISWFKNQLGRWQTDRNFPSPDFENVKAVLEHNPTLVYPIIEGRIVNWDAMECIWSAIFKSLKVDPRGKYLFMTEPALSSNEGRARLLEWAFEKASVSAVSLTATPVMALYGFGKRTGVSVDIGEGLTQIVPIIDGKVDPNAVQKVVIGGGHVTQHLQRILRQRGYNLQTAWHHLEVNHIKEKLCFISCDFDRDHHLVRNTTSLLESYAQPNGHVRALIATYSNGGGEVYGTRDSLYPITEGKGKEQMMQPRN